jgi:hypothetical protein
MSPEDKHLLLSAISAVDVKVDKVTESVQGVISAFEALTGAFAVLETIGKIAKPVLWVAAGITSFTVAYDWIIVHVKGWFHLAGK